jgi:ATP-binding cassette subfamily B protein
VDCLADHARRRNARRPRQYYLGFQTGLGLLQTVLRALAGLYEDNLFLTNLYQFLDLQPAIAAPARPKAVPATGAGV